MKTKEQLKDYTSSLLNKLNFEKDIDEGFLLSMLFIKAYIQGLSQNDFPIEDIFSIELKDIPEQWHASIAKLAILIKKEPIGIRTEKYLRDSLIQELEEFKRYYLHGKS